MVGLARRRRPTTQRTRRQSGEGAGGGAVPAVGRGRTTGTFSEPPVWGDGAWRCVGRNADGTWPAVRANCAWIVGGGLVRDGSTRKARMGLWRLVRRGRATESECGGGRLGGGRL